MQYIMEAYGRAPDPLKKTGDMASNWHNWKKDFIIFMNDTGYINKPTDVRANILKNQIGKVGLDAIQTITFDKPQDKYDMDILFAKLDEFFNPKNEKLVAIYNDYKINTEKMKQVTKEYTESTPKPPSTDKMKKCWRCDSHPQRKCPACYSNNKKNHKANSATKDMDPMNEMISFPDIPTVSCDTTNSTLNNIRKFNFLRTLIERRKPVLYFDEVVIQSTYFGSNTQRNNAYVRRGPKENQRKKPIEMTPRNPPKHIMDAVLDKHKEITLLSSLMKKIQ